MTARANIKLCSSKSRRMNWYPTRHARISSHRVPFSTVQFEPCVMPQMWFVAVQSLVVVNQFDIPNMLYMRDFSPSENGTQQTSWVTMHLSLLCGISCLSTIGPFAPHRRCYGESVAITH